MWQEIIVGVCVLIAMAFLLKRWFFNASKSACGGCNGCDKTAANQCSTGKSSQ